MNTEKVGRIYERLEKAIKVQPFRKKKKLTTKVKRQSAEKKVLAYKDGRPYFKKV